MKLDKTSIFFYITTVKIFPHINEIRAHQECS